MIAPMHRIYSMPVSKVYPLYVTKVERKGRTVAELDEVMAWLTGVICGVRIEEIEDPLMKKIRYMDKLVDELYKGRPMTKVLRQV
jgi:hypothetical protein